MLKGETESGIAAFQKAVELSSNGSTYMAGLGWFAKADRRNEAQTVLDHLLRERASGKYVMASQIAIIYAELQDRDEALRWLEKGYEERSAWMVYLKTEARYDSLRSDPRFCELLRRMKFPT